MNFNHDYYTAFGTGTTQEIMTFQACLTEGVIHISFQKAYEFNYDFPVDLEVIWKKDVTIDMATKCIMKNNNFKMASLRKLFDYDFLIKYEFEVDELDIPQDLVDDFKRWLDNLVMS